MRDMLHKIERIIFYLFVFAIPFEKRLIIFQWQKPFHEWTSGFIYGTDVLIFALLILWAVRIWKKDKIKFNLKGPNLWLALFFVVAGLSVFNSKIVGLSVYQLLKLTEFVALYFYLKNNWEMFGFQKILTVFIASGLFQAIVGFMQFLKQTGLGLRLLGESPLTVDGYGVAVFIVNCQKYLRAYGTTPHPNVLATVLLLSVFALYAFYFHSSKTDSYFRRMLMPIYAILLLGLFATFSRTVIAFWGASVLVIVLAIYFKKSFHDFWNKNKKKLLTIITVTIVVGAAFAVAYWPLVKSRIHISGDDEAVTQRIFYNGIAGSAAVSHPLLGIGLGQFVPNMMNKYRYLPPNVYQPAHNVYLLIASEAGFLGLIFFLLFIFSLLFDFVRKTKFKFLRSFSFFVLVLAFLLTALFDHLFWTLQQGSLIFWASLALLGSGYLLKEKETVDSQDF